MNLGFKGSAPKFLQLTLPSNLCLVPISFQAFVIITFQHLLLTSLLPSLDLATRHLYFFEKDGKTQCCQKQYSQALFIIF